MSVVAEFARKLHEKDNRCNNRVITPLDYPSRYEKLYDIKAVVFDIYGTLINYWREEFSDNNKKEKIILNIFRKTSDFFGFLKFLEKMNPQNPPEKTLNDFYHGLIGLDHEKSLKKGIGFPEVRIENVWEVIIMMLGRYGYKASETGLGNQKELAKCVAYYYNFHLLARGYYYGVTDALSTLYNNKFKLGIVSNAQFYTPIDLTLFLRDRSNNKLDNYLELFDKELVFLSYEYGVAKQNQLLFRKLYDALYEYNILPSETVFVGNDLSADIKAADEAGMRTAFFAGDNKSAFIHDLGGKVIPDITLYALEELPEKISLFGDK